MPEILKSEARRLWMTVLWSWHGWASAWATEKTLRQWSLVNALLALAAFALPLTGPERAVLLGFGLLILAAELINTAIETIVDDLHPETHPAAKRAKDCGSACVALSVLACGLAWMLVLIG